MVVGVIRAFQSDRAVTLEVPEEILPSIVQPSELEIANYNVPPESPRYLSIPKLNVKARVKPLGINDKNQLRSPDNIYDTGWYTGSSKPGEAGAMLIDGHVSSWSAHGVFYSLKTLNFGDQITIERGDGKKFSYKVITTRVYDFKHVDMAAALRAVDSSRPGLNLITCDGEVIKGTNEFNKRLIVFASQM